MSNQNRDLEDIMSDLNHINFEFRQKVQAGTSDPDNFMKLHEIERLWKELRISTEKIYSEQVMSLIADIDESVLILKKNQPVQTPAGWSRRQEISHEIGKGKKHCPAGLFSGHSRAAV